MSVLPRTSGDTSCDGKRDPNRYSQDASTRVTAWAIRRSGPHNDDGAISTTKNDGMPDHNFVGEILEVGVREPTLQNRGRAVVPFTVSPSEWPY